MHAMLVARLVTRAPPDLNAQDRELTITTQLRFEEPTR